MLLLNLRNEDLLCRYAGDRYAVLLPGMGQEQAQELAGHLCSMVGSMRHATPAGALAVGLRHACTLAEGNPEALLAELGKAVDLAPASGGAKAGAASSGTADDGQRRLAAA
jgi:GGDEF domain-containing protein